PGYEDLREADDLAVSRDNALRRVMNAPFDLVNGPLFRFYLLRTMDNEWVFCYVMHHIISDGWSVGDMIRGGMALYDACPNGSEHALAPLRIQYKDYAVWQQTQQDAVQENTRRAYWLEQFRGELPVPRLPADKPRPVAKTYNGGMIHLEIDELL